MLFLWCCTPRGEPCALVRFRRDVSYLDHLVRMAWDASGRAQAPESVAAALVRLGFCEPVLRVPSALGAREVTLYVSDLAGRAPALVERGSDGKRQRQRKQRKAR